MAFRTPSSKRHRSRTRLPADTFMCVIAYHVSGNPYAPSSLVRLSGPSRFVTRLTGGDSHYFAVENELERVRPLAAQSRFSAVFAYPSLGACRAFWEAEQRRGTAAYQCTPAYYRVTMPSPTTVPSHLVARTSRRMLQSLPHADILSEFWAVTRPWQCFELMDVEFTVVDRESTPVSSEVGAYQRSFRSDFELAQSIWPIELGAGA